MSRPDRNTPRPVNTDRAPPTTKCESIDTANESTIAAVPDQKKNGKTGSRAPTAVAARVADPELLLHLLAEHPLGIAHHPRRERVRLGGVHALRLVDQRQLVALHLGHERDLVALHRDLVRIDLLLAFRR